MCVLSHQAQLGKESACNAEGLGSIPGLGRSPGERKGYLLQYSGLENSMDLYSSWGRKELDMIFTFRHLYVLTILEIPSVLEAL